MTKRMKAVILAAGIGKRIPEFTADIPKCLIPITSSGETILQRLIAQLISLHVNNIRVVVGKEGNCWTRENRDRVKDIWPHVRVNKYNVSRQRNQSLLVGVEDLESGPVLIIDGDIILGAGALQRLIESRHENVIVVRRFAPDTSQSRLVIKAEGERVIDIVKKTVVSEARVYTGLTKIGAARFSEFKEIVEAESNRNANFTDVLLQLSLIHPLHILQDNTVTNVNRIEDLNDVDRSS